MKTKVIHLLLILMAMGTAHARHHTPPTSDSTLAAYSLAMENWLYKDLDSSKKYACLVLDHVSAHNDPYYYATAYSGLAYYHLYRSQLNMALSYGQASYGFLMQHGDSADIADAYMNLGNIYTEMGHFEKGLDYYQMAENHIPEDSQLYSYTMAFNAYNMAETFLDLDDHTNCQKYLDIAEQHARHDGSTELLYAIDNIKAELLYQEGKWQPAHQLAEAAYQQSVAAEDYQEQVRALEIMAKLYSLAGQPAKAVQHQREALHTALNYGDNAQITEQKALLAKRLMENGQVQEAYPYAHQAHNYASTVQSLLLLEKTSKVLAQVMESIGNYKDAIGLYKTYQAMHDSLSAINLNEKLLLSEREVSRQKNDLLRTRMALQNQMLRQNNITMAGIAAALLLSLILIVLLVINLKRRYKAQKQVEEKQRLIDRQSRQLKTTNENLSLLNQNKDKLFSVLTHDLKQPFNQTLSLLELLKNHGVEDKDLQELIEQIHGATVQTKSAIDNILLWSKAQFSQVHTKPVPVAVKDAATRVLDELSLALHEKNIEANILPQGHPIAMVDVNQLEIILKNLLQNAIKFSEENSTIEVEVAQKHEQVWISVKDEGKGMTREQVEKLFDENTHFSTPGTLNEKGTGLGILIVNQYVAENQGRLEVESQPGQGTIFHVILPAGQ